MPFSFPDIGTPTVREWVETRAYDPTNRTKTEGGYAVTFPRTTRSPVPKKWHCRYPDVSDANKALVEALEDDIMVGSAAFAWTNPKTNATLDVRLLAPISYRFGRSDDSWSIEFDLEQV